MSELERIEDQLRRGMEGGAWHGPAILELLAGVTSAQAHMEPVALLKRALASRRTTA